MKRWCRTTWQMKCCSHLNIFDLVLEKEMQLSNCWISLFSMLKRMITVPRQTWKEGEHSTFLIFLGTNNPFGKWCLFLCRSCPALRILQIGNRNKVTPTIVIGLKTTLHQNLVKFALDKEDRSVFVYFSYLIFYLQLQCVMCLSNHVLCLWTIRNVCNLFNRESM